MGYSVAANGTTRPQRKFETLEYYLYTDPKNKLERDHNKVNLKMAELDVIISVSYRVKSYQGTQFRIWATQVLREYLIKGFALNDERMKSGKSMNYFDELQERIPADYPKMAADCRKQRLFYLEVGQTTDSERPLGRQTDGRNHRPPQGANDPRLH